MISNSITDSIRKGIFRQDTLPSNVFYTNYRIFIHFIRKFISLDACRLFLIIRMAAALYFMCASSDTYGLIMAALCVHLPIHTA